MPHNTVTQASTDSVKEGKTLPPGATEAGAGSPSGAVRAEEREAGDGAAVEGGGGEGARAGGGGEGGVSLSSSDMDIAQAFAQGAIRAQQTPM